MLETDVVIIGAGIAGLRAAMKLSASGLNNIILEANHSIGGRACSEPYITGGNFDVGCSYLHEGEINPFVSIARGHGFELGDGRRFSFENWNMSTKDGLMSPKERAAFWKQWNEVIGLLKYRFTHKQNDLALSSCLEEKSSFAGAFAYLMAGLNASDITEQSLEDFLLSGSGLDFPVLAGLGSLVKKWVGGIKVELDCEVRKINWGGKSVNIETSKGVLKAKRVIVTASTGVLAKENIEFKPSLPNRYMDAIFSLRCGTLNKIGFRLKPSLELGEMDGWHIKMPTSQNVREDDESICAVDIVNSEKPQAVVFIGGSDGKILENLGKGAMGDHGVITLNSIFGSSFKKNILEIKTTAWANCRLTYGSYSFARVGHAHQREVLSTAIKDQIYFAGEATSKYHHGTCHGAYFSGEDVAEQILRNTLGIERLNT